MKTFAMKTTSSIFNSVFFFLVFGVSVFAQYDDVYYDPSKFSEPGNKISTLSERERYNQNTDAEARMNQSSYPQSEEEWEDLDDQEYYYSSRIRRFHRNYYCNDFYDPFYTSVGFYDPWIIDPFLWGNNIGFSIGYGAYPWWRYNRWNSWASWGNPYWGYRDWYYGYCPIGFSYNWAWSNSWYSPWSWNNWYNPYFYNPGFNNWGGYGWGNNWCPGGWYGGGGGWYDSGWNNRDDRYSDNPKGSYYGSRRGGFAGTSRSGPIRLGNPDRTVTDKVYGTGDRLNLPDDKSGNGRSTDRNKNWYHVDEGHTVTPVETGSSKTTERKSFRTDAKPESGQTTRPDGAEESGSGLGKSDNKSIRRYRIPADDKSYSPERSNRRFDDVYRPESSPTETPGSGSPRVQDERQRPRLNFDFNQDKSERVRKNPESSPRFDRNQNHNNDSRRFESESPRFESNPGGSWNSGGSRSGSGGGSRGNSGSSGSGGRKSPR